MANYLRLTNDLAVTHLLYPAMVVVVVVWACPGAERESVPLCHDGVRPDEQGSGNGPHVQEARHQRCSQGLQVTVCCWCWCWLLSLSLVVVVVLSVDCPLYNISIILSHRLITLNYDNEVIASIG